MTVTAPPALTAAADRAFATVPEMLRLFDRLFGPYPQEACSLVVTADELEIPLEAQGLAVFGMNHLSRRTAARRARTRPPVVRQTVSGSRAGATSGSTRASPATRSGCGRKSPAAPTSRPASPRTTPAWPPSPTTCCWSTPAPTTCSTTGLQARRDRPARRATHPRRRRVLRSAPRLDGREPPQPGDDRRLPSRGRGGRRSGCRGRAVAMDRSRGASPASLSGPRATGSAEGDGRDEASGASRSQPRHTMDGGASSGVCGRMTRSMGNRDRSPRRAPGRRESPPSAFSSPRRGPSRSRRRGVREDPLQSARPTGSRVDTESRALPRHRDDRHPGAYDTETAASAPSTCTRP